MIKQLLSEAKTQLDYFFSSVDEEAFSKLVDLCLACPGFLVFTGIGKSGIIAEKIANTLASTGTRALYLPALNFLHGDIGLLSQGDLVFLLSKSGETEELLELLPFIERKKAQTIALTAKKESRLAQSTSLCMHLPMQKELCAFDLVPTTSTQIQLIFGDILAVALMKKRNFSLSDYALNHPSGAIGKKMTLRVKDLMVCGPHLPVCSPKDTLSSALLELTQKKSGTLLVLDSQSKLAGIFTDGDLRRALQTQGPDVLDRKMEELMTPNATTVSSNFLAFEALRIMQQDANKWVMVTPVVEDDKVVGLLRMHDIIQAGLSS